jgi:hypothetical protein
MKRTFFFVLLFFFNSLFFASGKLKASETPLPPDTVQVGSYIVSLHDINFRDKEYVVRFWVWMLYDNVDFDFAKRVEVPNAKVMEIQDQIVDSSNGKIWVLLKLRCVMKQSWKVNDFPFDSQNLEIRIENSEFDNRSMVFKALNKGKNYDPNLTVDGWNIKNFRTSTQSYTYETDFGDSSIGNASSVYDTYRINVELDRSAWWLFLKIFVGMFISFMIAYISLFVKLDDPDARFSLPVGGLFGSVGNKYIIDSILPETSTFTLADTLHAATFFCIFAMVAFSVFSLKFFKQGEKDLSKKIDQVARKGIFLFYLIICLVFISLSIFS